MSDTWQGPGWRRADDGKWYPAAEAEAVTEAGPPPPPPPPPPAPAGGFPPPSAPPGSNAPPPPAPPTAAYPTSPPSAGYPQGPGAPAAWAPITTVRPVSPALAGWLQGLFWAVAGTSTLMALAATNARTAFEPVTTPPGSLRRYQDWLDADALVGLAGLVNLAARITLLVLIIVWGWRCHKAAAALSPGLRKWTSGWTIGGWFVPVASIVIPKLVIDETERIAKAPRVDGTAIEWRSTKVSGLGTAWWWLFVLSTVLATGSGAIDTGDGDVLTAQGEIRTYYWLVTIAGIVAAVSAVCGALFTKDLSRRLSPAGLWATAPHPGGGLTVAGTPVGAVDVWATRTAQATAFCEICREPLQAQTTRCPRCGKRRTPTAATPEAPPPGWPG